MAAEVEYRCFVGGLAWATDNGRLEEAFKVFGDVVDTKVISDRETGRSRGFGFVTFREEKSMMDAIESMNGQDLDGRSISVHQAQQRTTGGGYNRSNANGGNNRNGSGYSDRGSGYSDRGSGYSDRGGDRGTPPTNGGGARRFGGGPVRSDGRSDADTWRKSEA